MNRAPLRNIPSVDRVLRELGASELPRPVIVAVVRRELDALRKEKGRIVSSDVIVRVRAAVDDLCRAKIRPVVNGTGILIHTNLGRSPLGDRVVGSLSEIAANYNNIEYDLTGGRRGGRAAYLEHNLAVLTAGQAATVVNNCAAALVLILRHFTSGDRKEVVISRGELVQIGGGFRIPEILEASGAVLREVGTTNKTSVTDYAKAITKRSAMILKVHRSNFFMAGFVESPDARELYALARKRKLPLVEDLGSGAVVRTEEIAGVDHEPTPAEVLKRGADLVCFSGDKLLGGPQAGIITGKARLVAALKREPFFRALRCDKLILGALQATVDLYLQGSAGVTVIEMLRESPDVLRARAGAMIAGLSGSSLRAEVGAGKAQIGGGTLPKSTVPSVTVDLIPASMTLSDFAARMRTATPPVIGYIGGGRFKLDLRTIFPRQDGQVLAAIRSVLG